MSPLPGCATDTTKTDDAAVEVRGVHVAVGGARTRGAWAGHPYCILDAEWVTPEQREAARLYEDYLLAPEQQAMAVDKGLRPADQTIPLHAPIALENGTDPSVTRATVPNLLSPFSEVAVAIKEVFHLAEREDIPTGP